MTTFKQTETDRKCPIQSVKKRVSGFSPCLENVDETKGSDSRSPNKGKGKKELANNCKIYPTAGTATQITSNMQ